MSYPPPPDTPLIIAGLGPGGLDGAPSETVDLLMDSGRRVVVRTLSHPAAEELAARRPVIACDDLYEQAETFAEVYEQIAERVMGLAAEGPVAYAVPGSPWYGEQAAGLLRTRGREEGMEVKVLGAPSFLDAVFGALDFDPMLRGFTVLDGRELPDPLILHLPTVIFQVDAELVLADVLERLGRTLPPETQVTLLFDLESPQAQTLTCPLAEVSPQAAGLRTTLFIDPPDSGLVGAIKAMRRLRLECPWDRRQTHDSLAPYAVEETFELLEAIARLAPGPALAGESEGQGYADLEEELGDLLLQVIFHANLAQEQGWFGVEEVAETLRAKLVYRHPHVFGEMTAETVEQVLANWAALKQARKPLNSLMDGVPEGLPGLERAVKLQKRAARVGFDWPDARSVVGDVEEELAELQEVIDSPKAADELGDVLFAAANLARHLGTDPELALRRAVGRFEERFRLIEEMADLEKTDVEEMNRLWEKAKEQLSSADE